MTHGIVNAPADDLSARLCELAYYPLDLCVVAAKKLAAEMDFEWEAPPRQVSDPDGLHSAYVFTPRGGNLFIAVRGVGGSTPDWVESALEWVNVADVRKIPCETGPNTGKVHRGFHRVFTRLRDAIEPDLPDLVRHVRDRDGGTGTITVTGHGTGGAVAVLLAYHLRVVLESDVPVSCVTFGAPRVGDGAYVRQWSRSGLSGKSRRYLFLSDAVPHALSPWSFRHCGDRVVLGAPAAFLPRIRHVMARCARHRGDPVRLHSVDSYARATQAHWRTPL